MQDQLFNVGGPVKILSRRRRDKAQGREVLWSRLVGEGRVKHDPTTGLRYDTGKGFPSVYRAYLTECVQCHEKWWASARMRRESKEVCGDCRFRARVDASTLPDGTRRETEQGYIRVKHKGIWKFEHRAVIEGVLGRPLRDDETVHHINGDRTDNRPENLQLRQGNHGSGRAAICHDCGSSNIDFVPLDE